MPPALVDRLAWLLPRALMLLPLSVAAAGVVGALLAALPQHPLAGSIGTVLELWGIAAGHIADSPLSLFALSFEE